MRVVVGTILESAFVYAIIFLPKAETGFYSWHPTLTSGGSIFHAFGTVVKFDIIASFSSDYKITAGVAACTGESLPTRIPEPQQKQICRQVCLRCMSRIVRFLLREAFKAIMQANMPA